jgi:integrase
VVEEAKPHENDCFIWCDDSPGFGVRIYPSGKRGYVIQYRVPGHTRRARIGWHGILTVDEARKEAKALLGQVAKGGDPAAEHATRRHQVTVRALCERYLEEAGRGLVLGKGGGPKKPRTTLRDQSNIQGHILPLIGNRKVIDLTQADIYRFLRDVAVGKTARVAKTDKPRGKSIITGGRGAAARAVGLLGGILTFARSEGIIASNPVHGVRRPADQKRTMRLTPETYRRLGMALDEMRDQACNASITGAIWMLALTGARKSEIEQLRWTEIDEPGRALRLEDSKEGASIRPIGSPVFELLHRIQRQGPYVFPGRTPDRPYGGLQGAWERLKLRADLPKVTLHTLRHSFASTAADLGLSEPTIAAMIGHASGSISGRYIHHLDVVLIAAADKVAKYVQAYMRGETAEVVAFPTGDKAAAAER